MLRNKKISVVISFFNEESNIEELVRRVRKVFRNDLKDIVTDYEMIFVNDASTDRSKEILLDLSKNNRDIKLINMSRNFGVTPCVIAGMEYSSGDAVIYMDADLQDPPEIIPELIKKWENGADVVHATRTKREGEKFIKMLITKYAYKLINWFSDIQLPENTGDFKLLSRRVVNKILGLKEFDPYMRGLSVWVGFKQEVIFYERQARYAGITHFPLLGKGPTREFIRGIVSYSSLPLYLSFYIGLIVSFISVVVIIYSIMTKVFGISAYGISGVLIAVSFFSGIIMITNGLTGVYIARIYDQVKQRPRYIVESTVGFD